MTPADIRRQVVVEELDLSPDGRIAVVARRTVRGGRYVTHIHAVPLDGGRIARPRQLTRGIVRDGSPRISPDGRRVTFIEAIPQDEAPASAMVLDLARGTSRALRRVGHGSVGEVAWSPDGKRLAFTAEVDPPRFLVGHVPPVAGARGRRRGATTGAVEPSPLARRITRADWRWDGEGHQTAGRTCSSSRRGGARCRGRSPPAISG
jgi:dipeptidyl aminopeptidase/acylaminoacyl peptidase